MQSRQRKMKIRLGFAHCSRISAMSGEIDQVRYPGRYICLVPKTKTRSCMCWSDTTASAIDQLPHQSKERSYSERVLRSTRQIRDPPKHPYPYHIAPKLTLVSNTPHLVYLAYKPWLAAHFRVEEDNIVFMIQGVADTEPSLDLSCS